MALFYNVSALWITNAITSLIFPLLARASGSVPFFFFAALMVFDLFLVRLRYSEMMRLSRKVVTPHRTRSA